MSPVATTHDEKITRQPKGAKQEKLITVAYIDYVDQVVHRTMRGNVGYDLVGDNAVKVWENRETLLIPMSRLVQLIMHG